MDTSPMCRICIETTGAESMVSPCDCSGTMKYVHKECLLLWVNSSHRVDRCDVCGGQYKCRFVASRPNLWQTLRFGAVNSPIFLLALMIALQFFVGLFSAIYGLVLNARKMCDCYRKDLRWPIVCLSFASLCLAVSLMANVFWFCMYCSLIGEVVADNWRQNIVYTIDD